jgi:hypothetical protein
VGGGGPVPVGDELDGTSNRGSRGGRWARGGGGGAYRATVWREVAMEAGRRNKSGGRQGPPVLRAGQSESGKEGAVASLSKADGRARQGAAMVEQRGEKWGNDGGGRSLLSRPRRRELLVGWGSGPDGHLYNREVGSGRLGMPCHQRRRGQLGEKQGGGTDGWGPQDVIKFKTSNGSNLIRPKHNLPKLENLE